MLARLFSTRKRIYKELDSEKYHQLHTSLLDESTKINGEKSQPKQQQQQQPQTEKMNEKVKIKQKQLILDYRFENGPLSKFNREFRKLWEKISTMRNHH